MKKTLLWLALKFVAITGPLTWIWMNGGQDAYWKFFIGLARPILAWMGVTGFSPGLVRDRMISFIPFLALMLVTPHIPLLRRWVGIAVGFLLLFATHVMISYWAWASFVRDGRTEQSMLQYFPALVVADAMPFLIWAFFANRFLLELISKVAPPPPRAPKQSG